VSRLKLFVDQICTARKYTNRLLDATDIKDWFRQPHEGVTHIAWQVGHLAMADYRLGLDRIRGPRPEDESLISTSFLQLFGRDSVPAEAAKYPSLADIRNVFDRVHAQMLTELGSLSESDLDAPTLKPHSLFTTKGGSLQWCAQHEAIHAGQIGLLRRLLGYAPMW